MGQTSLKDFKVAIVGGGICGLACAVGLTNAGIRVDIFEAAPKFDEVGAGVGLGPNAIRALEGLGILQAVLSKAGEAGPAQRPFRFISGVGEQQFVYDYSTSTTDLGLAIYRPVFLEALMPLLDPALVHFNKRCTSMTENPSGNYTISFLDGTSFNTDLVIGADGIKSVIRDFVAGQKAHMGFTNTVAYRGLVPMSVLREPGVKTDFSSRPICLLGLDKHFITFPIRQNQVLNVVIFVTDRTRPYAVAEHPSPWVEAAAEGELSQLFSDWGHDAQVIIEHMKMPNKWYIHAVHPPLCNYVRGRVALIGDAAHGMLPHLGAGAGQGLEDVYALCRLLGHPDTMLSNLKHVLKIYDTVRPPRANMVLERSKRMGDIYENFHEGLGGYDIPQMQKNLAGMWEPVWHYDLEREMDQAVQDIKIYAPM